MLTIGVDIRVLGSKAKSGIEEYTENILANLFPIDPKIKYKLFYSSFRNTLPKYEWAELPNVEIRSFKLPNKLISGSFRFLKKPNLDELLGGVDVFFSPHFLFTPLSVRCKRVTVFHDLSYLNFPEFFSLKKKIWHNFMAPKWQANFSNKIITVSESTKSDLSDKYDIDPSKIKVVYSGISPMMKVMEEQNLKEFKTKNNLPDKFILFLGKLEPRKNIAGLIKAFNLLKTSHGFDDCNLLIAGSMGWLYEDIFEEINKSPYRGQIRYLGYLKNEDRPFLYNLASVFVYPSFFEGFGLPPLEAMACGKPVITSNNSSLPEVVGNAALMVNPNSVSEMAAAMKDVLSDQSLRNDLIKKGLKRAHQFEWQKAAGETLDVLTSL